jgi:hypothetical protein
MSRVYTDVRVERFDVSVYDLPTALPGLVSIDFNPPSSGPEYELTFASAEGADAPTEDFIRQEVERVTLRTVLAIRQRPGPVIEAVPELRGCARCGGDHTDLAFEKLEQPVEREGAPTITFWCPCPTNGQPILMRFEPRTFACRR